MREKFIKRFAAFFAVLVLLQETHAFIRTHQVADDLLFDYSVSNEELRYRRDIKPEEEEEEEEVKLLSASHHRQKRSFTVTLLVISGVSGLIDIYKQEVGCDRAVPSLQGKVDKASRNHNDLLKMKDRINLAWVPVSDLDHYITRMDSDMRIVKILIADKDALLVDIVRLIDNSILTKMDRAKRTIENEVNRWNESTLPDPDAFNRKFYTEAQYAMSLSFKFGSIGLYLGGRFLLPRITGAVSKAYAADLKSSKPKLVTKWIDSGSNWLKNKKAWTAAKWGQFKTAIKLKWAKFNLKFPGTAKALKGIGKVSAAPFKKAYQFYRRFQNKIKFAAKGGLILFTVAFEIWGLVKFHQQCFENLEHVEAMLETQEQNKKNMTGTLNNIAKLVADYNTHYSQMKANFSTPEFIAFLNETIQLAENAKDQTDKLTIAKGEIQTYMSQIVAADKARTDALNQNLISGLRNINYKLDCVRSKLSIISTLNKNCAEGKDNFDKLFTDAKNAEKKKVTEDCIAGNYMTKSEIEKIKDEDMIARKKQKICVRNSKTKLQLVCSYYYDDVAESKIVTNTGLNSADIKFFINACPPGTVGSNQITGICDMKADGKTSTEVKSKYFKFAQNQVTNAYNGCKLRDLQKSDICGMKDDGHAIADIQEKYQLYPAADVKYVFDNCPKPPLTPFDKNQICMFKKFGFVPIDSEANKKYWVTYVAKYGAKKINQHLATCPAMGDAPMTSYHEAKQGIVNNDDHRREEQLDILQRLEDFMNRKRK